MSYTLFPDVFSHVHYIYIVCIQMLSGRIQLDMRGLFDDLGYAFINMLAAIHYNHELVVRSNRRDIAFLLAIQLLVYIF